ncbi:MAG: cation:proton antiporter [Campylobacterota bacterium]
MESILIVILSAIAIATILNVILRRFNVPTIIGYIFTGAMIAYMFDLGSAHNGELAHIAEFGIVFLMFTIGLEISFAHLKSMKYEVFVNGAVQVLLTAAVVFAIAHFGFGQEIKSSIIIGAAIALSSTAIVLKVLNESGKINSEFGKRSLGILLFQDMAVVPILLMITIFASDDSSLGQLMTTTLINAVIALLILYILGKYVLERVLKLVADSNEIYMGAILLIVVGSSYIAHAFGFSYSLGAFIAGMMIAETKYRHQIEADLIPFRDILLGLFFITIGMQIDFSTLGQNIYGILGFLVTIMTMKALLIFAIVRVSSQKRTAIKTAMALSQIGEFSLAIVALANSNGLLEPSTVQVLIVTVVLSMIITPFILNHISKLADIFAKESTPEDLIIQSAGYRNHVIVCGYGNTGQDIVKRLEKQSIPYVIIEIDLKLVEQGKAEGRNIVFGNAAQKTVLENVDIKNASSIIVAIDNFAKLQMVVEIVHQIRPGIDVVARVENQMQKEILGNFHLKHVVSNSAVMADLLVDEALSCKLSS